MNSSRGLFTKLLALGRAVRNRWRQSFISSITVLALLGVVGFAAVIGRIVNAQIKDQAFARAKDAAQITARARRDRKSTRLNSSHCLVSRMPSSA